MPNPPIDEVFEDCFKYMNAGARELGKKVDTKGHALLKGRYYKSFRVQLDASSTAWDDAKDNVRHAARHIGKLAAVLADFEKSDDVEEHHAEAAGRIMESQCAMMFGKLGRWCEPAAAPEPAVSDRA